MKASSGMRRGTRRKFSGDYGRKMYIRKSLQTFKPNDRVIIKIDPTIHGSMPYSKFYGCMGTVKAKRGKSYIISIITGNKEKIITASPEHMKPAKG